MFTWLESTVTLICKMNVRIQRALWLKRKPWSRPSQDQRMLETCHIREASKSSILTEFGHLRSVHFVFKFLNHQLK